MLMKTGRADRTQEIGEIESWGGAECTVNRVGDEYRDQLEETGHSSRPQDLELLAGLGFDAVRFPILWERVSPDPGVAPNWDFTDQSLNTLRSMGVRPIAGLVHHGSGPRHTSLVDPGFAKGLAEHAARAAERYPWIRDWTPVNEPLTTARFSALYGIWYPHARDERQFWLALLNQVDAVRFSMRAIRKVNPAARLIQTDDLGRTYATPRAAHQAAFDNQRRWMSWDLLCGMVDPAHPLWRRLCKFGFQARLRSILADPCPPDVIGINHYLTSDRLLDERIKRYPPHTRGGNRRIGFCDIEAIRVLDPGPQGLRGAIEEAWARYRRPIAITEVHNGCTREEQIRWVTEAWSIAREAKANGVDLRAVTAWAVFGSQGWNTLLTDRGEYEPGIFDVSSGSPRETALAEVIRSRGEPQSILAEGAGWWRRPIRWEYPTARAPARLPLYQGTQRREAGPPILITGATGTLGQAIANECRHRDITPVLTARGELDLGEPDSIGEMLDRHRPWAVVNTAGWVRVDDAESEVEACMAANAGGAIALARACGERGIPCVNFSSDLVFGSGDPGPYDEDSPTGPLGVYGRSKAEMETAIAGLDGQQLVIRTAAFFSPNDRHNFAVHCIEALAAGDRFAAVDGFTVSPTYVPDLCRGTLDLLIDGESGIWHLSNGEGLSWFAFAQRLARAAGLDPDQVEQLRPEEAGWAAPRPVNAALSSKRGPTMPSLQSAINRFAARYRPAALTEPTPRSLAET